MHIPQIPRLRMVAGLGNPGERYARTYHNAGFLALDFLRRTEPGIAVCRHRKNFDYCRLGELVLVRPLAFMNESGPGIRAALRHFRVRPEELLLVHDDADLPLGSWRLGFGRGAAGHHGVLSVAAALGTRDFWRLRIGIRSSGEKAGRFVLQAIRPPDREKLGEAFYFLKKVIEKTTR